MDPSQLKAAGLERKARSIARLQSERVPTIDHLPWIECDRATVQPAEAVVGRVTVISLLAVYAEPQGMPRDVLEKHLKGRGVQEALTPKERAFLALPAPTEQQRGAFTWQYECAHVMLWALGFVESLGRPTAYCNAQAISKVIAPRDPHQLLQEARPQPPEALFDEADLAFRYHWAARNAMLQKQQPPAGLLSGVCYFRHYALNWLIGRGEDWDRVDTST